MTVLFADIVDFTKFSESLSPESLVGVLNGIFSSFATTTCGSGSA